LLAVFRNVKPCPYVNLLLRIPDLRGYVDGAFLTPFPNGLRFGKDAVQQRAAHRGRAAK